MDGGDRSQEINWKCVAKKENIFANLSFAFWCELIYTDEERRSADKKIVLRRQRKENYRIYI